MSGGNIAVYDLFNPEGEQILHSVRRKKATLGGGWVAIYKKPLRKLLIEAPNMSTLKVYLYIASKQTYQKLVMITPTALCEQLKLGRTTVFEALKWLTVQDYIAPMRVDGNLGYLVNPNVSVAGAKTKQSKAELWGLAQKLKFAKQLDDEIAAKSELVKSLEKLIGANLQEIEIEEVFGDEADSVSEEGPITPEDVHGLRTNGGNSEGVAGQ